MRIDWETRTNQKNNEKRKKIWREKFEVSLTGFPNSRFLLHVDNNRLNYPIFHDDDTVTERLLLLQVKAWTTENIYMHYVYTRDYSLLLFFYGILRHV